MQCAARAVGNARHCSSAGALDRAPRSVFSELQRLAYLPVAEAAYTVIADRVFTHVTELSLQWHTSKRTGAVMRALDRGLNSASTIVNQLFLRLGPTVVELIVLCIIAAVSFDALAPALCLLGGFIIYAVATVRMTAWRREIRAKMLKQDNTASQIAADALGNAEAVKTFANEEYEQRRYADAVLRAPADDDPPDLCSPRVPGHHLVHAQHGVHRPH